MFYSFKEHYARRKPFSDSTDALKLLFNERRNHQIRTPGNTSQAGCYRDGRIILDGSGRYDNLPEIGQARNLFW